MDMIFYGTGAAEGIPNPFCDCPVCRQARKSGGRQIRRRTMFRLNEGVCIDLGADSFCQAIDYGDFTRLRHVLVTHTHEDHLTAMMMNVRNMAIERSPEPLSFYLTENAFDYVEFLRSGKPMIKGLLPDLEQRGVVAFHRLAFGEETEIGGFRVIPLRGNHKGSMGEDCANYRIRLLDGSLLYYGLDTGWYREDTLAALAHTPLDLFISECTFGLTRGRPAHPDGHLDAYSLMALLHTLAAQGTLTPDTRVYLAHINHYTSGHDELTAWFQNQKPPCPVTVAWDGCVIPRMERQKDE